MISASTTLSRATSRNKRAYWIPEDLKEQIWALSAPTRAKNALIRGIASGRIRARSIEELKRLAIEDLEEAWNMGAISAQQIVEALSDL